MTVKTGISVVAALVLLLRSAAGASQFELAVPPGVNIRLTDEGPIFVSANGMALYAFNHDANELFPLESCTNEIQAEIVRTASDNFTNDSENLDADFAIKAPDSQTRRTCVQKRPPLLAPSDAQAVGNGQLSNAQTAQGNGHTRALRSTCRSRTSFPGT
ncbi:hypothetical protein [Bradyrhizobium brasilense]|uniref:hypothetical protein n=1 Tax=Bradyrhizobium brasilense TaxID=1419277 RepID=UPI003221C979